MFSGICFQKRLVIFESAWLSHVGSLHSFTFECLKFSMKCVLKKIRIQF